MNNPRSTKIIILFVIAVTLISIFFIIFKNSFSTPLSNDASSQTDKLSGKTYVKNAVLSSQTPNPRAPYFVGFEELSDSGLSSDTVDYVNDTIVNYILYVKKQNFAKISFVKDSFRTKIQNDGSIDYSFQFGINDRDIQPIEIKSNILDEKITVLINSGASKYEKEFKIFPIY